MASNQPYDPYIPSGGQGENADANNKTNAINERLQQVQDLMRDNMRKTADRGDRLDTLQDKTTDLAEGAQGFRRGANRVRKQMWWKDMKMRMCIIVGIIILLVVIIVPSVIYANK